jgi:nucleotide-binding universal stress UspA family protein
VLHDTQIVCPTIDYCKEVSPSLIKHILLPFDETQIAFEAFEFALDLAKKYNAKISLITIVHSGILSRSFIEMSGHQRIIEKEKLKTVNSILQEIQNTAKKFNVDVKSEVIFSQSVAETILSFASHRKIDLIEMGTRGREGSVR